MLEKGSSIIQKMVLFNYVLVDKEKKGMLWMIK